ncbi:hypothetical protein [uncultured Parasphingopyxis sp.]|uniref:PAS domain-containing protein n=1 Tax=uncultured Parasphingopyxis sp. TaxID=1547918 RepID=UPI0026185E0B|nr:hypothetical protein [uncultured Parasphingopyxis sp.]
MDNSSAIEPDARAEYDDVDAGVEAPPEIGTDERRMHVRAYNYWTSLLHDRAYPAIEDLDPESIEDFGPNSVLLDFTGGVSDPQIAWLGKALRAECGIEDHIESVNDVPSRSLLSRLTDHYMQIIANQAPVGFEAEFVTDDDRSMLYRGILMPFSSDDDAIDFIYGVINWKEAADSEQAASIAHALERDRVEQRPPAAASPIWADGPSGERGKKVQALAPAETAGADVANLAAAVPESAEPETLADFLVVARESAEVAKQANQRSRSALYSALGRAYEFALASENEPELYAELLDDAGIKQQDRAPMTPLVKLVFGADYDKTRLTEFATALTHAKREAVPARTFADYLAERDGGLKAIVAEERALRRPEAKLDKLEEARAALREARIHDFVTLEDETEGTEEFALLMARRIPNGRFAVVGAVPHDKRLTDKAIRSLAAKL